MPSGGASRPLKRSNSDLPESAAAAKQRTRGVVDVLLKSDDGTNATIA